ncbi:BON domain-containing protein [Paraburkholderia phenazinium]|jgi:osmotically-inducible protein OsmY|uniref:BON domain-containing protein n=1 Tax=Paraburkholderia phenazinium TaxID=60549 RepID=A0A1G7UCZ3_9BURK|nr:BON domain-containing protein [Paraburkholderia phenazinium]SDG45337.1 BON domain-containing protein [Paraburkholderia phenazinium]
MKHALSSDDLLQRAVLTELHAAGLPAGRVGVTAHAGIVTLLGHVEHADHKQTAENAALWVEGVRAVVVAIEICAPGAARLRDDQIASEALMRLAWDAWVPHDALKVTVEQGSVTLAGQVDRAEQKAAALEDVRRLFGVAAVSNRITVKRGGKGVRG